MSKDNRSWEAWLAIKEEVEGAHNDWAIEELFPLVYRNLMEQGFTDPGLEKLKRISMFVWIQNNLRFNNLEKVLKAFQAAKIDTILLKGAAFIPLYYQDQGARGMGDVDLLVADKDFLSTCELLESLGWNPLFDMRFFDLRFNKAVHFKDPEGYIIDLHHRILYGSGGVPVFLDELIPLKIGDVNVRTLSATDHLLHTCVHGLILGRYPPIRWIADGVKLFEMASEKINWERLFRLACECGVQLQLKLALNYLQKQFNSPVPQDILRRLSECQIRPVDRFIAQSRMQCQRGKLAKIIKFRWYDYRKAIEQEETINHFHLFPKYLQSVYQIDRPLKMFSQLVIKALRNICYRMGFDFFKD